MQRLKADREFAGSQLPCTTLRQAFEGALPMPCWSAAPNTSVFVALFNLHDWQPWLDDAYELMDATECRRVQSRLVAGDRDRLALGYALHRLLLGNALGCDPADVPIGRDAAGCPRLPGRSVSTSLSHADWGLALAVTASGPVGVDIEASTRSSVMPEIASRVCHPADSVEIDRLAGQAWNEALLSLWVRKEAFLKAAGIGLQREMHTFAASDNALLALPGGGMTWVRMFDVGPQWFAAIATGADIPVESAWFRPDGQ